MAASELGIQIVNKGINGDTTPGMLGRFSSDVLKHKPSHVIIMGGANDAFAGVKAEKVVHNIRLMVEMALSHDQIPMIGLPTPCNFPVEEAVLGQYRKAMKEYAVSTGIKIIDFYSAMVDEKTGRMRLGLDYDDIHPNEAGYKVMAGMAISFLCENLGF